MDGLKLAQLSSIFAGMGQSAATYNPAQRSLLNYLQGSSQSAIAAEAQKKAEKKANKKDTLGTILGVASAIPGPQQPFVMGANTAYGGYKALKGGGEASGGSDLGSAITNTANMADGFGGAMDAYEKQRTPAPVPLTSAPKSPTGDGVPNWGNAGSAMGGMDKPNTNNADVWANTQGGIAQKAPLMKFYGMKPHELRDALHSSPNGEQELTSYLSAGGQLSERQLASLPPSAKRHLRQLGYDIPGPLGVLDFGGLN